MVIGKKTTMASKTLSKSSRAVVNMSSRPTASWTCAWCRHNTLLRSQIYKQGQSSDIAGAASYKSMPRNAFSTSSAIFKKSSSDPKSSRKSPAVTSPARDTHIPDNAHSRSIDNEPDPYDYTELQSAIDTAISRLKDALARTRDVGRVSTEMIEALPVELNVKGGSASGASAHKEKARLGDLASVVPKGGRMMQIFAAEEGHVKPLTNAVQASDYSLAPQPDAQNPLLILVPVPPATAETRQQAAAEAKKMFDKASLDVRNARGDAQKKFRKMEIKKIVVPDELKKAHKGMEDVARKGQDEVKKVYEGAVKALQF